MRPPCSSILRAVGTVRVMILSRKTSWFLDLAATPSYDPDTQTRKAPGHAVLNGTPCTSRTFELGSWVVCLVFQMIRPGHNGNLTPMLLHVHGIQMVMLVANRKGGSRSALLRGILIHVGYLCLSGLEKAKAVSKNGRLRTFSWFYATLSCALKYNHLPLYFCPECKFVVVIIRLPKHDVAM